MICITLNLITVTLGMAEFIVCLMVTRAACRTSEEESETGLGTECVTQCSQL